MVSFTNWAVWTYTSNPTIHGLWGQDTTITTFSTSLAGTWKFHQKRPDPHDSGQTTNPIFGVKTT